jgi:hypothetical protein
MLESAGVPLVKTSICLALRLCIRLSCDHLTVEVLSSNPFAVSGILILRTRDVVSLEGLDALVCFVECAA